MLSDNGLRDDALEFLMRVGPLIELGPAGVECCDYNPALSRAM